MKRCEWCLVNAGRTYAERQCCRLRALAQMPANRLLQYVAKWTDSEKEELRPQLIAEKQRLRNLALPTKRERK